MVESKRLVSLLDNIVELLEIAGESNWVDSFRNYRNLCDQAENHEEGKIVEREILQIFAGAGSFSDLVLHSDGDVLIDANIKLDEMRTELHELIIADIVK